MTPSEDTRNGFQSAEQFFLRIPLGQKISVISVIVILFIAILVIIYLPARRYDAALQSMIRQAKSDAGICAFTVSEAFKKNDTTWLFHAFRKFSATDDLAYMVLCDKNDSVVISINPAKAELAQFKNLQSNIDDKSQTVKVKQAIYFEGQKSGFIYLGLSSARLEGELNTSRSISLMIGLLIISIGFVIIWLIQKYISIPLNLLLQTVQAIKTGSHNSRVPVLYNDEIGKLAESFNELVDQLEVSNQELAELNTELEERVQERTAVLEAEIEKHKITTTALRRSQTEVDQYRASFVEGPIVIIRMKADANFRIEYTSENISQYGYFSWELIQGEKTLFEFMHPDDHAKIQAILADNLYSGNTSIELTFKLQNNHKEIRYVYCWLAIQRNEYGKAIFYNGYLLDITGAKRIEQELWETQSRFKIVFEKNSLGIVLSNLEGKIIEANEAFQRFVGYTIDELREKNFQQLSFPDDLRSEMIAFRKGIVENHELSPICFEKRYIHKSGIVVWGRITATFVRNAEGDILFGLAMIDDISQIKKDEIKLARQNKFLKSASNTLTVLLKDTNIESALPIALQTLGSGFNSDRTYIYKYLTEESTTDEFCQMIYEWCKTGVDSNINDENWNKINTNQHFTDWFQRLKAGKTINCLIRNLTIEEKEALEQEGIKSIVLTPLLVHEQLWGVLGFDSSTDEREMNEHEESIVAVAAASIGSYIERFQAEEQLLNAKERAQESDKLKTTLLSNMSHEFRTPMNAILGYGEILADRLDERELKDMANSIRQAGSRLLATLECILDLSQLESKRVTLNIQPISLSASIRPFITPYQLLMNSRNLSLRYLLNGIDIRVLADITLLEKAFKHIFENAIKFTEQGGIDISFTTVTLHKQEYGCIEITDSGIGIPKEHQHNIFNEFRQVSEGLGRGYEGSGLGLAVAARMTRLMNGEITLESEVGKGSKFSILLPIINNISPAMPN